MRFGALLLIILLIGSVATHFLLESNGYVLINFQGYAIEMSVPILVFVLFALYLAVRTLVRIWQAPRQLGEMAARAKANRSGRRISSGFIALSEGKLARGERLLTKGAAQSEAPLLNYLAAARAAQAQGDQTRRDGWLKIAYDSDKDTGNAVLLTQAELQIAAGEYEAAHQSLEKIRRDQPNHPLALRMLGELCYQQQDWAQLTGLFPALRKAKNTSNVLLDKWTIECFEAQLLTPNIDLQSIEAYWQQLPRALRKNNRLISARVNALINCNEPDLAGSELQKVIKSSNDPELIGLYGELKMSDADAQLRHTEKWLTQHPEDPVVLLAAGRACIRNKLWGKARSYIETSIGIAPTPAAFHELGQLMLQLDDPAAATNAFAKGLTLSNTGSLNLPQLEKNDPAIKNPLSEPLNEYWCRTPILGR